MGINYLYIEKAMNSLLDRLSQILPKTDIITAKEFIDAGEYGVAFEHIVDQLYDYDAVIDEQIFSSIAKTAQLMEFPSKRYEFLRELIQ